SKEFSATIVAEAKQLAHSISLAGRSDFTSLFAITIDSEETRDIDDALSLERIQGGLRLGIHISDVQSIVGEDSPVYTEILRRGPSIYLPDAMIPMTPPELSEHALSLLRGEKRATMSFLIDFEEATLQVLQRRIELSTIEVKRRLNYEEVDKFLY